MEEKENMQNVGEEDEESFKTRSEEEDEMYLEALMKEAQGGNISKVTIIKTEVESSPGSFEEETAEEKLEEKLEEKEVDEETVEKKREKKIVEEELESRVPVRLPEEALEEEVEEAEEEAVEEAVEEETTEKESEEEVQIEFPEGESFEEDESSKWEDPFEEDESTAVKKYIFGVSLDYVELIDEMDLDERSAFVNDAINIKLDKEREDAKKYHRNSILKHIGFTIVTILIGVPLLFWVASKSIELTANNYKRMQQNFEKLWTEQAKRDATMRNVQQEMRK